MNVICDKCKKGITIEIKIHRLADGVERVYFSCPHCDTSYTAYYSSKSIKKKQARVRELQQKYETQRGVNPKQAEKTFVKMQELKAQIGRDMDKLKERIERA